MHVNRLTAARRVLLTIPARNEEATIGEVVDGFRQELTRLCVPFSIHVFDDGSTDKTVEIAECAGAKVFRLSGGKGLAAVFRDERRQALQTDAEYILHADADGQHSPQYVGPLLDGLTAGADLVLGARLHARPDGMPEGRYIANQFLSQLVSSLSGVRVSDSQTGFRAMNRELLMAVDISSSFTYTQEQIIRSARRGLRIAEVPINVRPRLGSTSRLVRSPIEYMAQVFRDLEYLRQELGIETTDL